MDELIQKLMDLLSAAPIIPLIIAFSLLRRFISKPAGANPETDPRRQSVPPPSADGYDRPQTSTFDAPAANPEFRDPSIAPAPADSLFGGKYGTTKFGFDESEWGSTFEESQERERQVR